MPQLEDDSWLTVKGAADRLNVSEGTIRRYIRRDGLPVRMGRIRESELLAVEAEARARMEAGQKRGHQGPSRIRRLVDAFRAGRALDEKTVHVLDEFVEFADGPGMYRSV